MMMVSIQYFAQVIARNYYSLRLNDRVQRWSEGVGESQFLFPCTLEERILPRVLSKERKKKIKRKKDEEKGKERK